MDRLFDRLGDLLRTVLGGDQGSAAGHRRGRPQRPADPDLAAAWEELDAFLDSGAEADEGPRQRAAGGGRHSAATAGPREHLRRDYAALGVAFGAPLSEVKSAYKRLMRTHHPDRFANDPRRQAAATRKAAAINEAYARIERASRTA